MLAFLEGYPAHEALKAYQARRLVGMGHEVAKAGEAVYWHALLDAYRCGMEWR